MDSQRHQKRIQEKQGAQNIKTAGSYIDISCENSTHEDTDLEMYDFGWVVNKTPKRHQSVNQETLNRCSRWLVNNMNPDGIPLDDVFDSEFMKELKTEESHGDKNRHILRKLHDLSDSDFDKFVQCLNASQPDVASRLRDVREQVNLFRMSNDTSYEDDFANDFDTD